MNIDVHKQAYIEDLQKAGIERAHAEAIVETFMKTLRAVRVLEQQKRRHLEEEVEQLRQELSRAKSCTNGYSTRSVA